VANKSLENLAQFKQQDADNKLKMQPRKIRKILNKKEERQIHF
jgi:hypothetical protein